MLTNAIETSNSIANFYLHEIVQIQRETIISLIQTSLNNINQNVAIKTPYVINSYLKIALKDCGQYIIGL